MIKIKNSPNQNNNEIKKILLISHFSLGEKSRTRKDKTKNPWLMDTETAQEIIDIDRKDRKNLRAVILFLPLQSKGLV